MTPIDGTPITAPGGVTTYYAQASDLRAELGVDAGVLPDDQAQNLITDAEDIVDNLLGAWRINLTTGRKIFETNVLAWQFAKLTRATVKLAGQMYARPDLFTARQYESQKGPDFTVTGPLDTRIPSMVTTILNQSGLRRLTTNSTGRIGQTWLGSIPVANGPDDPEFGDDGLSGIEL